MTALLEPDALARDSLRDAVGGTIDSLASLDELSAMVQHDAELDTIIFGPSVDTDLALEFTERLRASNPTLGVVVVRRRIDANVLTQALRAGVREVVSERDLTALAEAVVRSRSLTFALRNPGQTAAAAAAARTGQLITVFSPKGGAGKTTFAVNMGVALATSGQRTLLLDLDLAFGDVPISLGLRPEHDFTEVVTMGERLDAAALKRLVTIHESGLHVLAPPTDPGVSERVSVSLVRRLIQVATAEYEYVVVDTAPSLDERSISVMEASDSVFMLTTLDIPSLKNLKIAIETLKLVNFPMDRVSVVMNRADSKVGLDAREVEKSLGVPVVAYIPSSRLVPAATNRGVAIVLDQPRHPVTHAIKGLIAQHVVRTGPVGEKRGFLGLRRDQ